MIGRAYVWGLGAGGQEGVAKAIDILRRELDVNMALCGVRNVRDLDRSVIVNDGLAAENGAVPGKARTRARKR